MKILFHFQNSKLEEGEKQLICVYVFVCVYVLTKCECIFICEFVCVSKAGIKGRIVRRSLEVWTYFSKIP